MNATQARRRQENRYARWDAQGEGSRGGAVVGRTKSGKPIYKSHDHPAHADLTQQESEEANTIRIKKFGQRTLKMIVHPDTMKKTLAGAKRKHSTQGGGAAFRHHK